MKNHQIFNQTGRSMVEMLGVLMIIGLLSVLGFWSYMRAQNQLHLTKQSQQVSDFSIGLLNCLRQAGTADMTASQLATTFVELGYLPDSMIRSSTNYFMDAFGHEVSFQGVYQQHITVLWRFTSADQFVNIMQTLQRYSSKIFSIWISGNQTWYGDRKCSAESNNCLSSLTLADFNEKAKQYPVGNFAIEYFKQ
jgi:hypothetical protein